jgi:ankyrin repeat protein
MKIHWLFLGKNAKGEKLLNSALWGNFDDAKWLLKINTNVDFLNEKGRSALSIAAGRGHTNFVKLLLEKGAKVDQKDEDGSVALISAACEGHTEIVTLLLQKGADVNFQNEEGTPALWYAAWTGQYDTVKLLIENGASINVTGGNGETALMTAVENGHTNVAQLLIENGAKVNVKDDYRQTALMKAAFRVDGDNIVKSLLEKGAIVDKKDEDGNTALIESAYNGNFTTVKLLLEKGANVNHQNKERKTALIISAEKGYADIVKLLLEYGAKTKLTDLYGDTAKNYASNDAVSNLLGKEKVVKSDSSKPSQHPISLEEILSLKYTNQNEDRDWEKINDFKSINDLLIEAQMSYYDYQNNEKYKTLLNKLPPISKFHDFDIIYIWTAKTYVALENVRRAKEILFSGLEHSKRLFYIMEELANTYFEEDNYLSFGWWMQSCIIGTDSYMPYLYLSYAAMFLEKDELSKRLLAASDIISMGSMYRFNSNDIISGIYEVFNINKNEITIAFETFENKMNRYLPSSGFLPDDDDDRSLFLSSDLFNIENSKIIKARKKLIERFAK